MTLLNGSFVDGDSGAIVTAIAKKLNNPGFREEFLFIEKIPEGGVTAEDLKKNLPGMIRENLVKKILPVRGSNAIVIFL